MVAYGEVLLRFLRAAFVRLQGLGHDPAEVLRSVGIPPWKLLEPLGAAPLGRVEAAWDRAAALSGDPHVGLYVPLRGPELAMAPEFLGLQLLLYSEDVRSGLLRYAACYSTAHSGAVLALHGTALVLALPGSWRQTELLAALLCGTLREVTGGAGAASEVHFRHRRLDPASAHERVLAPTVRFGMPDDRLVFSEAALAAPMPGHSPALLHALEDKLRRALIEHARQHVPPGSSTPVDAVRRLLEERLGQQTLGAADVAREMGFSVRSLTRRLQAEGLTFRALLDEVRAERARRHVVEEGRALEEVAPLVGYSDARALHRAWRRWFGETPESSRRRWPELSGR